MTGATGFRPLRSSLVLVMCLAAGVAAGQVQANYQPYIVGERAAGMGGAVVATADGMDACFYNPAGLGGETRDSISVNGTLYGIQNLKMEDASFPGDDINITSFETIPTGLSMVKKIREGTVGAFSVFVPSQSSAREIQSFPEKQHYYNFSRDEQTLQLGFSAGHVVNDRLSVGASAFGIYQNASEFSNLYWGDYAYTWAENYKYSVFGVIGTLAAQYRFTDTWSAGITLTSPSATVEGNASAQFTEVSGHELAAGADSVYFDDMDADNGVPANVRAGIGWRVPNEASVGFDITHHFARNFNGFEDSYQDGTPFVIRVEREAVTDLQLGGEYIIRQRFPIRAGFFTSFSSAPDVDPEQSIESQVDLYGLTASMGSIGKNVVLNFGASYVFGSGDSTGNGFDEEGYLQNVVSEEERRSVYVFASTAYRF